MSDAPLIEESSLEERRAFIKEKYPCIADCDMCGLAKCFMEKIRNRPMLIILSEIVPLWKFPQIISIRSLVIK